MLSDSTSAGISATYHSDGFIYSESGHGYELERISVETGQLDTVAVPDGMLEWQTGHIDSVGGHALITSDGTYIYNVSMSSPAGRRTGWGVRVFDPADNWRLVREFVSPPTETGFTFLWTDGVIADGERLYLIEYGGQRRIRMVDAVDGRFLDEWTSDQDTTRIITGQYDWINNKVWLGDLLNSAIFRYTGVGSAQTGSAISEPVGPARSWESVSLERGADELPGGQIQVEEGGEWVTLAGFGDLGSGPVELSGIDAVAHPRLRVRVDIADPTAAARLEAWQVRYRPRASLLVADADARLDSAGRLGLRVAVRNLSPFAVADAELQIERGDGELVARRSLAPLDRGESRVISLDSLVVPPVGVSLFARLAAEAAATGPGFEIPLLFAGRAPVTFRVWPAMHVMTDGDPLRPDWGIVVTAPRIDGGHLVLSLDGETVEADSVLDGGPEGDLQILYRPVGNEGRHLLRAQLFSAAGELGSSEIAFSISADLTIGKTLLYPHPVAQLGSDFTYVLSHDAEISVEIFSMGGRLIRGMGPLRLPAGFQQTRWDGRDAAGQRLANGTYFYRLRAVDENGHSAERRGSIIVLR